MLESGLSGSVRGVPSNGHPYRDPGSARDSCTAANGPLVRYQISGKPSGREGWTLWRGLASGRPSRRARERAPLDEVIDDIDMIRTSETVY
jgi:hypothetical protein